MSEQSIVARLLPPGEQGMYRDIKPETEKFCSVLADASSVELERWRNVSRFENAHSLVKLLRLVCFDVLDGCKCEGELDNPLALLVTHVPCLAAKLCTTVCDVSCSAYQEMQLKGFDLKVVDREKKVLMVLSGVEANPFSKKPSFYDAVIQHLFPSFPSHVEIVLRAPGGEDLVVFKKQGWELSLRAQTPPAPEASALPPSGGDIPLFEPPGSVPSPGTIQGKEGVAPSTAEKKPFPALSKLDRPPNLKPL